MSQKYNVAVLGATGLVGRQIIETLADRKFPVDQLFLLASSRSAGEDIKFRGETIEVQDVEGFDFSQAHIGLFSAGGSVSEKYAPIAADAGCIVIDNTSHFRNDFEIPQWFSNVLLGDWTLFMIAIGNRKIKFIVRAGNIKQV